MAWLKLTTAPDNQVVVVNTDKITCIKATERGGASIFFGERSMGDAELSIVDAAMKPLFVTESPEAVMKRIGSITGEKVG